MSKSGGNLTVQYNLRWTEELRDKIAEAAKVNTRSMNQEIVARLEESFEKNSAQHPDVIVNLARELAATSSQLTEKVKEQEKAYKDLEKFYREHMASLERIETAKEHTYQLHIQNLEELIKGYQELLKNQEK